MSFGQALASLHLAQEAQPLPTDLVLLICRSDMHTCCLLCVDLSKSMRDNLSSLSRGLMLLKSFGRSVYLNNACCTACNGSQESSQTRKQSCDKNCNSNSNSNTNNNDVRNDIKYLDKGVQPFHHELFAATNESAGLNAACLLIPDAPSTDPKPWLLELASIKARVASCPFPWVPCFPCRTSLAIQGGGG